MKINKMDPLTMKNKSLSKEETKGLLSIIEGSNIINSKKTDAITNKMKVDEWVRITKTFNATVGTCRRTPRQLRLKWENLKKNSRKRSTLIRMERNKNGGRLSKYFRPDEILDRVAALLAGARKGFTAMYCGDAEPQFIDDGDGDVDDDGDGTGCDEGAHSPPVPLIDNPLLMIQNQLPMSMEYKVFPENSEHMGNEEPGNGIEDDVVSLGHHHAPIVPKQEINFRSGTKCEFLQPDDGRLARNIALTKYYNVKRKLLESKFENVLLENEKLKLEIKKLKGEDN